ncbi:hypothetical protein BGZ73_002341 [Actinomortierella ambigua]|nr:hypothetical protein BGZ73_002341 [Actinomortierella ambigua]
MSAGTVPEGLKVITPYLQRANQLADKEPIVSYYSNYYAAKLAIQKANKDNRVFIDNLLSTLEKQRKEIGDNEAISNDLVGYAHIENFALKIFTRADDEDRQGQASQKTAKNYVAAANFLELLKVFGDIDSDTEEKIKYSKWRAAEIVKAIRDGRAPTPPQGASNANQELDNLMATDSSSGSGGVVSPTFATQQDPAAGSANFMAPTNGIGGGNGGLPAGAPTSSSHPTIANFPSPPLPNATPPVHQQPPFQPPSNTPQPTQFQDTHHVFQQPHTAAMAGSPILPSLAPAPPATLPGSAAAATPPPQFQSFPPSSSPMQPPFIQSPPPVLPPSAPGGLAQPPPSAPLQQPPPPQQAPLTHPYHSPSPYQQPSPALGSVTPTVPMVLDPAVSAQVQKHCKWTISALTYDDVPTAIENLEKALALLR